MLARQRLRALLDSRRCEQICWRCARAQARGLDLDIHRARREREFSSTATTAGKTKKAAKAGGKQKTKKKTVSDTPKEQGQANGDREAAEDGAPPPPEEDVPPIDKPFFFRTHLLRPQAPIRKVSYPLRYPDDGRDPGERAEKDDDGDGLSRDEGLVFRKHFARSDVLRKVPYDYYIREDEGNGDKSSRENDRKEPLVFRKHFARSDQPRKDAVPGFVWDDRHEGGKSTTKKGSNWLSLKERLAREEDSRTGASNRRRRGQLVRKHESESWVVTRYTVDSEPKGSSLYQKAGGDNAESSDNGRRRNWQAAARKSTSTTRILSLQPSSENPPGESENWVVRRYTVDSEPNGPSTTRFLPLQPSSEYPPRDTKLPSPESESAETVAYEEAISSWGQRESDQNPSPWNNRHRHRSPSSTPSRGFSTMRSLRAVVMENSDIVSPAEEEQELNIRERLERWQQNHLNDSSVNPGNAAAYHAQALTSSPQAGMDEVLSRSWTVDESIESNTEPDPELQTDDVLQAAFNVNYIKPGDLVTYTVGSKYWLGVLVYSLGHSSLVYTERGQWRSISLRRITFSIPDFLEKNEVTRLQSVAGPVELLMTSGMIKTPDREAPRASVQQTIKRLRSFRAESDTIFREHANELNRVHEIVQSKKQDTWITSDLKTLALKLLPGKETSKKLGPSLLAVHQSLFESSYLVPTLDNHRLSLEFKFYPTRYLEVLNHVKDWARQYREDIIRGRVTVGLREGSSNPFGRFVEKSRWLIKKSRLSRPLSPIGTIDALLPHGEPATLQMQDGSPDSFIGDESRIIGFLRHWASEKVGHEHSAIGPSILRAIGMYQGLMLDKFRCQTALLEMNATQLKDTMGSHIVGAEIPDGNRYNPLNDLKSKAWTTTDRTIMKDSMADFRKDWGEMPVFCVDSESAFAIDDGISIETDKDEPSCTWIHVHVANPSAFIGRESPISHFARDMSQTYYGVDQMQSMMSPGFVQRISLGKDQCCLTFSAKLSPDGTILDKTITPGLIHNVYHVSPERVDELLGSPRPATTNPGNATALHVGTDLHCDAGENVAQAHRAPRAFGPHEIDLLRQMTDVAKVLHQKRRKIAGSAYYDKPPDPELLTTRVSLGSRAGAFENDESSTATDQPTVTVSQAQQNHSEASETVREIMLLAGEISATWCHERQIPVLYRGLAPNPDPVMSPEAFEEAHVTPLMKSKDARYFTARRIHQSLLGQFVVSRQPLPQPSLGLPVYAQSTSPLRRYADLVAHFQIEAYLRHQDLQRPEKPPGETCQIRSSDFPYSEKELSAIARRIISREYLLKKRQRVHEEAWKALALHHAFYYEPAKFPSSFKATVSYISTLGTLVTLNGWRVQAWLQLDNEERLRFSQLQVSDVLDVQVTEFGPPGARSLCKPVGL